MNKFFILLLALASGVMATSWYVDNTAEGTNAGTSWANAWESFASIAWGASGIVGGDTLFISGGATSKTYNERLLPEANGTSGSRIYVRHGTGEGHEGTIIISPSTNYHNGITLGYDYITIDGRVGGATKMRLAPTGDYSNGIEISGTTVGLDISGIEITGCSGYGIYSLTPQNTAIGNFHNLQIHNNGGNGSDEVVFLSTNVVAPSEEWGLLKFYDNKIYNWHADAIKLAVNGADLYNDTVCDRGVYVGDHPDGMQIWGSYLRIYNNYFYNFFGAGYADDAGVEPNSYIRYNPDNSICADPSELRIYNNVFAENPSADWSEESVFRGIEISLADPTLSTANDIIFSNNIVSGVPYLALSITAASGISSDDVSNILIINNIFSNNGKSGIVSASLGFETGDGTITYGSNGDGDDVTFDYNCVYASTRWTNQITLDESVLTYANFKSTMGCQDHEVVTNPDLNDNYTEKATSPTISAGLALTTYYTTDKSDNDRGTEWDIGPYEFSTGSIVKIIMRIK